MTPTERAQLWAQLIKHAKEAGFLKFHTDGVAVLVCEPVPPPPSL